MARSYEQSKRGRWLYLISPALLILLTWIFVIVGVLYSYAARDSLPVLVRTMELNEISFEFPVYGVVWVGISLLVVLVFGLAATRPIPSDAKVIDRPGVLSLALKVASIGQITIVLVVIVWILLGARSVGGIDRLISMAAEQETVEARAAILDNKLFPGMRLLYTGLVGLGVFGACVFAANLRRPDQIRRDMALGLGMFLVSAAVLSILPIFMSQRILLVQMVLSTFVGVSMVTGRPFRLRYAVLLAAMLFTVWSLREAVTVGPWASDYSSARIGGEKLIYYFVNDFYNAVNPFSIGFDHTLGVYTFSFLMYFTGLEGPIAGVIEDRIVAVQALRAGGEFPAFTAHYVDFSWMGIFVIAALILLFTWVFNRAHRSFTFAVVYGQVGGALLLTPHVAWYSHHNFIFNIVLTVVVSAFIRPQVSALSNSTRVN